MYSLLKKIIVHSSHYPDRRDGPSGFKRSEESDSVFFVQVDRNVYLMGVLAYAPSHHRLIPFVLVVVVLFF